MGRHCFGVGGCGVRNSCTVGILGVRAEAEEEKFVCF